MADDLTLRYLGVAGWELRTPAHCLLVDPLFTRVPLWKVAIGRAVPDVQAIRARTPPAAGLVLVTHPHYDHIMDAPQVARLTGAVVAASSQGCDLLAVLGVPATQRRPITHGDTLTHGDFTVEVHRTPHRIMFGQVPYAGPLHAHLRPPLRASDYRIDQHFSFRISVGGTRILVASGIDDEPPVEANVLLVGADASRGQLARILGAVKPRLVMPNHWDDMFRPLSKPVRPSIKPTRGLTIPRRIDLNTWARLVEELAPGAHVVIPAHFEPYRLADLLQEKSRRKARRPSQKA
jgi:L-ascorbate metabolism protein UlaG (beta-lactamase superfamily)